MTLHASSSTNGNNKGDEGEEREREAGQQSAKEREDAKHTK